MSDRLHDFARAVVTRQEQQKAEVLDEETMKAVALELGMSEDELLAARAEGEARKQRARTLRQQGLVDEAVVELESAHAFSPLDLEASAMLADALVKRGRKNDDDADLQRARAICLAVLQAAPTHRDAASLLNVIKNNPAGEHRRVPVGVLVGVAVVVGVIALLLAKLVF
jgi:tetratricopeptide (TPR) repeat protein